MRLDGDSAMTSTRSREAPDKTSNRLDPGSETPDGAGVDVHRIQARLGRATIA